MSREELLRLAGQGLAAYPPSGIGGLAEASSELCETTGDVRYCVIADGLRIFARWLASHGDGAAIPNGSVAELDELFRRIPSILDESEPEVAIALARAFKEETEVVVEHAEERLAALFRDPPDND